MLEWAQDADASGVDSIWLNEGFGHDAFSGLTLLARETDRIALGTSIVNVFSRTPGTLAQQFATIDQLSGGRVRIGLGASAPGAIERFHGLPFAAPLARLRETTELLRLYWSRERFDYAGPAHSIERALPMGAEPVQKSPPIYLATLHPRSVRLTAELADGWLPAWIPAERLAAEIAQIRGWVDQAGRDAPAFVVRAPGTVVVAEEEAAIERARHGLVAGLAFFVARNGPFYYGQFVRQGLADEAAAIRSAWDEDGADAAATIAAPLADRFGSVGDLDASLHALTAQEESGVDLHSVQIATSDRTRRRAILRELVG
jgi:alkanesulfonate monooxygenase SsuD/methylene tetrahydromethanopterin reductase-like flavin-dependent oxidoreductase (luciferase family)